MILDELKKENDCECGLTEDGRWIEEVFDRYGCSCDLLGGMD
tara:strand:+ start:440 stop:565 length:126 start_codon:yes stop_codon:yes gene_type:complete